MINLLPEDQGKKIRKERNYRVFLILIIYFLLFLLFFSGTLYFLNIFSKNLLEKEKVTLHKTEIELSSVKERENKILEINDALPQINSFYQETVRISNVLQKVYESLPENAYIKSFHFTENGQETKSVVLNGYVVDLEDLLRIEDNLKNIFDNVKMSPEAWTKSSDINFTIIFEI